MRTAQQMGRVAVTAQPFDIQPKTLLNAVGNFAHDGDLLLLQQCPSILDRKDEVMVDLVSTVATLSGSASK